ncbi:hypothetical protein NFI96_028203, partial [Prochilodus magdalenae]
PLANAIPVTTMPVVAPVMPQTMPKFAFYLAVEITNRVYNESLINPESEYYKTMYEDVSGLLQMVYNCSGCGTESTYQGVIGMTFSNGSVIANSTIVFQTLFINAILVKSLFSYQLPPSNTINGLVINPKYTEELVTPIPAVLPTSGYTTTTPLTRRSTNPANTTVTVTLMPTSTNTTTTTNSTTTISFFNTTNSNFTSNTTHPHNTSTTTKNRKTEAVLGPTTGALVNNGNSSGGIPGWAIALLVLACIILLLLILLFIILIIRWCCRKDKSEPESPPQPYQHTPYERTTFKEPLSTPSYSPQTPIKRPISPFADPTSPKVNRTGMCPRHQETVNMEQLLHSNKSATNSAAAPKADQQHVPPLRGVSGVSPIGIN